MPLEVEIKKSKYGKDFWLEDKKNQKYFLMKNQKIMMNFNKKFNCPIKFVNASFRFRENCKNILEEINLKFK